MDKKMSPWIALTLASLACLAIWTAFAVALHALINGGV